MTDPAAEAPIVPPQATTPAPPPAGPGLATRVAALAALALGSALLGVLPHLQALRATGDPMYVADTDDLLYVAWSRDMVRHGRPGLIDAMGPESGPMMHPPILFVPPGLAAHALGLGMAGQGMLWRGLAGALIALGAFAAVRVGVRGFWVALGLAALLVCDTGLLFGSLARHDLEVALDLLRGGGEYLARQPKIMPHLRVVTPGLAIPLLFVHYALVLRARRSGRAGDIAWAAASLGVLIHAYFYFWTAILPGAALAWVLDAKGRRAFALTVAGGLALGLPAILHNAAIKANTPSDWLLRTEHFLPIARFAHLSIPKVTILVTLALAPWVWLRRRELTYLWCVLAVALGLLNHQVLTRLEIENFHYIQTAGLTLSLLLVLVLAPPLLGAPAGSDAAEPSPRLRRAALVGLAVLVAVKVPLAFWFRWEEGYAREVLHFRELGAELRRDVGTLPPGSVVSGDPHVQMDLAGVQEVYPLTSRLADYAARITDEELDERMVLDEYLKGVGRETLLELIGRPPGTLLDERHYEAGLPGFDAVRRRRRELVDAIYADPAAWVRRLGVTHVVLPADDPGTHLEGLGRRVAGGRAWSLWALDPGEPAPTPG